MINNHIYSEAKYIQSPNHGGTITPQVIIMHYTAGWTADSAIRTLTNPTSKVSAQIVIDLDGAVTQLVPFNVKAWHAGPSEYKEFTNLNNYSIGIEFVNAGFLKRLPNGDFKDSRDNVVKADKVGPVVEQEYARVGSGPYFWPVYTEAQLAAADALVRELVATYPIKYITGHENIDTRNWKTDPGPAFPWDRYKGVLSGATCAASYIVNVDTLNVRSGPGPENPVIDRLQKGAVVLMKNRSGDWVDLGNERWVNSAYLKAA